MNESNSTTIDTTQLSPRQAMQVAAALGHDPSLVMIRCEAAGCPAIIRLADAFSMAVVYRMPGRGKAPFQCPAEQHFACSHAHAKQALLACLNGHIEAGDHL